MADDEGRTIEMWVRRAPRSAALPSGAPAEMRAATYTAEEAEFMRTLLAQRDRATLRPEQIAALNSLQTIHELKALLDAEPYEEEAAPRGDDWPCSYPHMLGWKGGAHGPVVCATCHPPAYESLVHEWVNRGEVAAMERPVRGVDGRQERVPKDLRQAARQVDAPQRGKHHTNGHATEVRAALTGLGKKGAQKRVLLERYAEAGERGLTDEELAVAAGVSDRAHRTRRNDLIALGLVCNSGGTRRTATGSDSIVWTLTDFGRRVHELA